MNETIANDHLKHHDVNWMFSFHQYQYIGQKKPMVVLWVHHQVLAEIFLFWEKPKHVQLERMLEFVQKLCSTVLLSFMVSKKNCHFLILYKK